MTPGGGLKRPAPPDAERLLDDADRAERAGDLAAAALAIRGFVALRPDDRAARLRFGRLLVASGEAAAGRQVMEPLAAADADDAVAREATRRLAELDEAEGAALNAVARWQRLLADDIDDPQARAHLARLVPGGAAALLHATETLASPEGVETSRYRILRELGRGATASVYLARDVALDLEVALKVLHAQLAGTARSTARRRFFAEARMAAAIRHPGVVAIYDVDETARALAMEYVAGGTLRERLRRYPGGLASDERWATARSLLTALAFVHRRGVVHGDLKPSNLLLRGPGEVVMADFGAAELAGEAQPAQAGAGAGWSAPGGTPLYAAPEQFQGAPSSPATDLYATGAILWETTTGQPLRNHGQLLRGVRPDAPSPDTLADLRARDPDWAALILTLLAPTPNSRSEAIA